MRRLWLLVVLVTASQALAAPIIYSVPGSPYVERFDSMRLSPESATLDYGDDLEVPGWLANHSIVATGTSHRLGIGNGSSTTGDFWSFGLTGASERTFGFLSSNNVGEGNWGTRFTNNTGGVLDSFTLSYTAEQWHRESANPAQRVDFQYSTNATLIQDPLATWTTVNALSVTAFPQLGALAALDGNDPQNQVAFSNVTVPVSWQQGGTLWIRWHDINDGSFNADAGRDNAIGLDDLTFSAAVPEPASFGIFLSAAACALLRPRRRTRR